MRARAFCAAQVLGTNWRAGVLVSVNQWRILPVPTGVFIGLFSIVESYTVNPASKLVICLSKTLSPERFWIFLTLKFLQWSRARFTNF